MVSQPKGPPPKQPQAPPQPPTQRVCGEARHLHPSLLQSYAASVIQSMEVNAGGGSSKGQLPRNPNPHNPNKEGRGLVQRGEGKQGKNGPPQRGMKEPRESRFTVAAFRGPLPPPVSQVEVDSSWGKAEGTASGHTGFAIRL